MHRTRLFIRNQARPFWWPCLSTDHHNFNSLGIFVLNYFQIRSVLLVKKVYEVFTIYKYKENKRAMMALYRSPDLIELQ